MWTIVVITYNVLQDIQVSMSAIVCEVSIKKRLNGPYDALSVVCLGFILSYEMMDSMNLKTMCDPSIHYLCQSVPLLVYVPML